ncbi:MAG: hypothetical protein KDJ77_12220 [Rhodobiaceae bacterium]|nr:hypothetical protein [Rhodobiaceae bacterium]
MFALPALAATTVNVTLWDNPDMDMADNLGHGMGGDMSKASMGVKASTDKVPAGEVTFEVKNSSKDLVHEMIVSPLTSADEKLPYDTNGGKVDEDAAGHLGEVAELEPGQSGALRINLKPGSYILFCNIPGHYMGGMWTTITAN